MLLQRLAVPSGIRSSLSSLTRKPSAFTRCSYSTQPEAKVSDPLRILFCGSDVFSCYSLKALHAEHKANPGLIKSIDVMVRPGKAVGRGYKEIRQVPIQNLAEELSLSIHVRDTFTGWSLPQTPDGEPINLIVAVSFGLFVPPRCLNQAKYGGLNVHPSLLP
ncbi:Methionyl-tRNA formyltransferase, partial [Neurospora sp. IMI 360204]